MHLNYPVILKVTGLLTLIEGISMLPCVLTAMIYEEWNAARALFPVSMFCICIGGVTPPLAVCLFTSCRILKIRIEETIPDVWLVIGVLFVVTLLLMVCPQISLFLPGRA